jgi:hypothetical protein
MRLYHFTTPKRPFLIFACGLLPYIHREGLPNDAGYLTGGQPVVWLTRQETNVATAADIARCKKYAPNHDITLGKGCFGGPVRLTLNLAHHDKRLVRYGEWFRANVRDADAVARRLGQAALTSWYIYFGIIPPKRIETELTVALALPGLEDEIENNPNLEARASYAAIRDRLIDLPPDHPVNLHVDDASQWAGSTELGRK